MKTCNRCKIEKPLQEYHDRPVMMKMGLRIYKRGICIQCKKDEHHAKNPKKPKVVRLTIKQKIDKYFKENY